MRNINKLFTTRVYRHLLSFSLHAENEDQAREKARIEFFKKRINLTNGSFRIEVNEISEGSFFCDVFDFYFIESLHIRNYLFHLFCKIRAAISIYVGIAPKIIVVT